MQVTFRHKPKEKRKVTVKTKRAFASRKAHTKSRQGCTTCKGRRIKCDETRPECQQCRTEGIACSYTSASVQSVPTPDAYTLSLRSVGDDVRALLGLQCSQAGAPDEMHHLHHFHTLTVEQLGMKANHDLLVDCISDSAWKQPTMMHLMLAIAVVHFDQLHTARDTLRALPAPRHLQSALTQYRQELQHMHGQRLNTEDADSLVTTTFLLTVAGFCIDDYREDAQVQDLPLLLQPITAAGCLLSIMNVVPDLPSTSRWNIILDAFAKSGQSLPVDKLPPAFAQLCLDEYDDLYYDILCYLTPVLRAQPCTRHIAMLFAMVGGLWSRIQPRIATHDQKTLLLLAWWFTLLLRLDVWWLNTRAINSIRAIVTHLKGTSDEAVRRLLTYPASFGQEDFSWIWDLTPS